MAKKIKTEETATEKPKRTRKTLVMRLEEEKKKTTETINSDEVGHKVKPLANALALAGPYENAPIISLRGSVNFEDKDYIQIGDTWRHIANGQTWEFLKQHNRNARRRKKYITRAELAKLKVGEPISI